MTTPNPPSGASAAAPAAPRRHPLAPLVPLGLEVGAWLLLLTTGAIAFGLAGLARLDPLAHAQRLVDACISFF